MGGILIDDKGKNSGQAEDDTIQIQGSIAFVQRKHENATQTYERIEDVYLSLKIEPLMCQEQALIRRVDNAKARSKDRNMKNE